MKCIQKAVVALLFLFLPNLFIAQIIKIEAIEEVTFKRIEYISISGFKEGKYHKLSNKMPYTVFSAYDSVVVQAFGYKNKWITDFTLPQNISASRVVPWGVMLAPLNTEINEVIISAGKFEEKRKDVARQITTIKQKDIEFLSPATSADILQNNGNVLVQKSQSGGGSPIIRGFEANKVQIVIDGIRMNNAIYRGGHLQNVLRIDNNALERIEVIQGAGSVIYGSDALGGVMHFITKKPKLNTNDTDKLFFTVGANTRFGTAANELTGSLNFNFGWKKIALFTNLSYSQFGDLRQGREGLSANRKMWEKNYFTTRLNNRDTMLLNTSPLVQLNSGYTQLDFLQKVLFKTSDLVEHLINFQYSTTGDVPRYDRLNQTDSGRSANVEANRFLAENPNTNPFRFAEWYYGPERRLLLAYSLNLKKRNPNKQLKNLDLGKITVAWQNIDESRHTRRFDSPLRVSRNERVQVASLNADFQNQKGRNEFRYGGELIYNNVLSNAHQVNINTDEVTNAITRYPDSGSNMFFGAVYTTLNRELRKGFVLNSGLRYSLVTLNAQFNDTTLTKFPFSGVSQSNSALTGNLGAVYTTPKGWRFSILASTAFRAPNVDDLGKVFDSNPADSIVIVPNPDIKPEFTYNGEIGIGKLIGEKGIVEATAWYTLYRQAIVTQPYNLNGANTIVYDDVPSRVFANQNVQNAILYGGSLHLNWKAYKSLVLRGTVNYTYGRSETDSTPYPLAHIPPVFGRVSASWKIKFWQLEFFSLFNGTKSVRDYNIEGEDNFYQSTINGTPAWYTLNIRSSYQLSEYSSIQISVENILDQNYRVFSSGISAPGRNILVTFRAWL
jgi:hemoglobin/transferrin/lactoferrin receptor protein